MSAYIKLTSDDLTEILAGAAFEDHKTMHHSKNTVLLGILKAYVNFLVSECPNIHEIIKKQSQSHQNFDSGQDAGIKSASSLGSTQHLKKFVDTGLACLPSKPHQNSVDGISEAVRRLDLAMVMPHDIKNSKNKVLMYSLVL